MNHFKKERDGRAKFAQPLSEKKRVYTLKDMSIMFGVSLRTVYNWLDQNRFSFVKIGSKTYLTEKQMEDFLSRHEVKTFVLGRR